MKAANPCIIHKEGKKNLKGPMPRTYFRKMKTGEAQVYMRHTIKRNFTICDLEITNGEGERMSLYKHMFLYIFINIYSIYHEDMQVVL